MFVWDFYDEAGKKGENERIVPRVGGWAPSENGQYYEFNKVSFFLRNSGFCSEMHYETHLELKYLKVFVPTLIWVCYGSKM